MFEKILAITKNYAMVKVSNNIGDDILNYNVILEDKDKVILGEIEEIINNECKITFLGEFHSGKFYSGIIRRPTLDAKIRIINQAELSELVGDNDKKTIIRYVQDNKKDFHEFDEDLSFIVNSKQ